MKETEHKYIENLEAMENSLNECFKGLITKIEKITNVDYFKVESGYDKKDGISMHVKINGADAEAFSQWFGVVKDARGLKQSNTWAFKTKYGSYPKVGLEVDVVIDENGFYTIVF